MAPAPDPLAELESRLGYRMGDRALLEEALRHRSWCAEHPNTVSNERLEFLGDAVIGAAVADLLYRRYPHLGEGAMSELRKAVVSAAALADIATTLELGTWVQLGKGEDATGGRAKPSILADAVEALLGAVFLDGGPARLAAVVERLMGERLDAAAAHPGQTDPKSALQEWSQRAGHGTPIYLVESTGPDHARTYRATVRVAGGAVEGCGSGTSRKQAEAAAAEAALSDLSDPSISSAMGHLNPGGGTRPESDNQQGGTL